jgi:ZIP family zinc transporter
VLESLVLGAVAQSSLILTGLAVYYLTVPTKVVGAIAGYGVGALLGAIAFDLVPESEALPPLQTAIWLLIGAVVFIVADWFVETRLAGGQDSAEGGGGSPLGIVVGSVVDGVPESVIFGIGIATLQPLSIPFLAAVWISNIPQALAPSAELVKSGWSKVRMTLMWSAVVIACGVAALLGYVVATALGDATGARPAAFAAGGLLAMLTNSLVPFSYERAGAQAGIWAVVGFAFAVASSQ